MLRKTLCVGLVALVFACSSNPGTPSPGGGSSSGDGSGDDSSSGGSGSRKDGGTSSRDGGSSGSHDGGTTSGGDAGTGTGEANVVNNLTFSGCSPDMSNLDVVTNVESYDSIGIVNGSDPLDGDVQVALQNTSPSVVDLSTAERVGPPQNDLVINVMAGGDIFTNVCNLNAGGCSYDTGSKTYVGDPITGTFTINEYDPEEGKLDVIFDGVVLQSTNSTALCTVNGTITSQHLYP